MPKTKAKKSDTESSDSDSGPDDKLPPSKAKKSKADSEEPSDKKSQKDPSQSSAKGGPWTLEGMRQVSISEFRGRKYVDIREFYAKGSEILPGKKGIALSIPQWHKLMEIAEEVTAAVENQ